MIQQLTNVDSITGGTMSPLNFNPPAGCINDAAVQAGAGIQASKLQQQIRAEKGQDGGAVAATFRLQLHVVRAAGGCAVLDFNVAAVVAALGNATATLDLQANGVSLLTATITLDLNTAAYVLKAGSLAAGAANVAQNSAIEVVCTAVNAGTGTLAKGLFGVITARELAQ